MLDPSAQKAQDFAQESGDPDQVAEQRPMDASAKACILAIDDKPDNLKLLSWILEAQGYEVRTAIDGALALSAALSDPPDLILLDIMMPEMDGYEVCERLKADERTRDIPILFLSALGQTADKVKAFSVGGVDYVTKPFHAGEILARVSTHLAVRQLQKQLEAANQALEERNAELQARNADLQEALNTIQTLSGLIPICAWCGRKIEDQEGHWVTVEAYIEAHSEAIFTHGICPNCSSQMKAEAKRILHGRSDGEPGGEKENQVRAGP
jgi:CheY-like chemotaxis protein